MYSERLIVVQRAAPHEHTDPSFVQNPHAAQRLNLAPAQRTSPQPTRFTDWLGFL